MLEVAAIFLVITALLAYLKERLLGLPTTIGLMAAAGVAVVVTLLARLLTVGLPLRVPRGAFELPRGSWKVLTHCVVAFSILVQGLSIGRVVRRALPHG